MDVVDRIFLTLQKKNIEQKDFATAVGVAPSKVTQWKTRSSMSYLKRMSKIADFLDTSVEFLINGEEKSAPAIREDDEDALDRELISRLVELTPEELEKVDAFVQGLLAAR